MASHSELSRSAAFPPSFIFGVSTSSVQIEGAVSEGGRGEGIWDTFASVSGNIADGSTPAVTCDHFHKFREDISEIKKLGVDAYRFSISWPRLFPGSSAKINMEGVKFYSDLLDCLVEAGVTPFATLYHWDLPQFLQADPEVKGWSNSKIIDHFLTFAQACFDHFGDRVRNWITFNEIHLSTVLSCVVGMMPPGKSSDESSGPYIVAHHQLLAHAATVKLYRRNYQKAQKGIIGLSADVQCYEPLSESQEDMDAVSRCHEFEMGWILDPLFFGDYPKIMKEHLGERLPRFTEEQSQDIKGSIDFLGLNYYMALWATKARGIDYPGIQPFLKEAEINVFWVNGNGRLLGEASGPPEEALFRNCPWGLRKVLADLRSRYGDIPIYITENGSMEKDRNGTFNDQLNDEGRIKFLHDHISTMVDSIRMDSANLKGYFYWSMMDTWEWMNGYGWCFGLYHVDFNDPQRPRTPKASAKWLSSFLRS